VSTYAESNLYAKTNLKVLSIESYGEVLNNFMLTKLSLYNYDVTYIKFAKHVMGRC